MFQNISASEKASAASAAGTFGADYVANMVNQGQAPRVAYGVAGKVDAKWAHRHLARIDDSCQVMSGVGDRSTLELSPPDSLTGKR